MSDHVALERRSVLRASAAGLVAAIAGCAGGGGGGSTDEPADESTATEADTETQSGGDGSEFDGWLSETDNFDDVVDRTGQDSVTVGVGSEANGGNFGFDSAAVSVSAGTEVVWEWTGKGSVHNVAADDGSFESEMTDEEGHTFSQTFDSTGTVKYLCTPHESVGMKGVVVVE